DCDHDNGNRRCRLPGCPRSRRTEHDNDIHGNRDEFACSLSESIDFALRSSIFDGNVLVLDITEVAQALPEVVPKGFVADDAEGRHSDRWALRPSRERQSRRAAKREDAFSPSDMDCHAPLPRGSCNGADNITPGRAALRDFTPA